MSNPYYTPSGNPQAATRGQSEQLRDEFLLIQEAFDDVNNAIDPSQASGTSATSLSVGLGAKSLTIQADRAFFAGQTVNIARTSDPSGTRMVGIVTSYNSTTGAMVVEVTEEVGSGTYTDWTVSLGQTEAVDLTPYIPKTATFTIAVTDNGKWFDVTSGSFAPTFDTTDMENGFHVRLRNSGTGDLQIPASDGISNWYMYPGEVRDFVYDGSAWKSVVIKKGVRQFTSSGTFVMPPGWNEVLDTVGIGGGGGGGSGARLASGGRSTGGGGGGAGVRVSKRLYGIAAGTSITVTVGAGGTAGAAVTVDATNGNNGTAGGNTTFGSYLTAYGGGYGAAGNNGDAAGGGGAGYAGAGGNASGGTGGSAGVPAAAATGFGGGAGSTAATAGLPSLMGGAGGGGSADNSNPAGAGGNSLMSAGGGGGGGSIDTGTTVRNPGAGGATNNYATASGSGGAAGTSHATTPTAGTAGASGTALSPGAGGGGGGSATGAASAAGGAGGAAGGGGGGGGASRNGFNSGAGGAGGRGEVIVMGVS